MGENILTGKLMRSKLTTIKAFHEGFLESVCAELFFLLPLQMHSVTIEKICLYSTSGTRSVDEVNVFMYTAKYRV